MYINTRLFLSFVFLGTIASAMDLKHRVESRSTALVQELLIAGANFNAFNGDGDRIAIKAIDLQDPIFLKMLLAKGLNPDALITYRGKKQSLLLHARNLNKPKHYQALINARAGLTRLDQLPNDKNFEHKGIANQDRSQQKKSTQDNQQHFSAAYLSAISSIAPINKK